MIFQRLARAMSRQGWSTILIELVLVIVGVFIALQVSIWNQGRIDRMLEREYIARMYADVNRSIERLDSSQRWVSEAIAAQRLALSALRDGELSEQDRSAFEVGLKMIGYADEPEIDLTTVSELQSTGNMTLIRDIELRALIGTTLTDYETAIGWSRRHTGRIYQLRTEIDGKFGIIDTDELDSMEIEFDFDALAEDTELINIVSQIVFLVRLQQFQIRNTRESMETFRVALADKLDRLPSVKKD